MPVVETGAPIQIHGRILVRRRAVTAAQPRVHGLRCFVGSIMATVAESVEVELMQLKGIVRRYLKLLKSKDVPYEAKVMEKGALVEVLEHLSRE